MVAVVPEIAASHSDAPDASAFGPSIDEDWPVFEPSEPPVTPGPTSSWSFRHIRSCPESAPVKSVDDCRPPMERFLSLRARKQSSDARMRFVVEACDSSDKLPDTFRMFAQHSMTPKTPNCPFGEQTPECWPESAPYTFFDGCASPMRHLLNPSPRRSGGDARLRLDRVRTGDSSDKCSRMFLHGMTPKTPNCPYGEQTPECWPEPAPYKFFDDCASPMRRFLSLSPRKNGADARLSSDLAKPCDSIQESSDAFGLPARGAPGTALEQVSTSLSCQPPSSGAPTMPATQRSVASSSSEEDARNPARVGAPAMVSVPAPLCFFAGQPQAGGAATQLSLASAVQQAVAMPAAVAYSPAYYPYIQVNYSAALPAPGSDRDSGVPAKDAPACVAKANRLPTIDEALKKPQERKQLPVPRAVYIDLSGLRCKK